MTEQIEDEQNEIIVEFINEARELIDDLEPTIISLESVVSEDPELSDDDVNVLNSIFRLFHSIKGGAGFLGFKNIVESTHTAENLLDKLRNGTTKLTPNHVDLLCHSCDFTKEALDYVEEHNHDEEMAESSKALIAEFNQSSDQPDTTEEPSPPAPEPAQAPDKKAGPEINLDISLEDLITPETKKKFLEEADDLIQEIEEDLLKIADNAADLAPVERLFRNVHSFKGNCGFLGFADLEKLSHTEENLLDFVKSGKHQNPAKAADMLLELIDVFKEALEDINNDGQGKVDGLDLYIEIINHHMPEDMQVDTDAPPTRLGDILVEQGAAKPEDIEKALETQNKPIGEILVETGIASKEQVDKALKVQKKLRPKQASQASKAGAKRQDIRVDLDKLDNLINLIGEMVIAENMVIHNPDLKDMELESFNKAGQHLSKIVRELQEMAMVIRMVPISGLFRRMIRLVHDLSRKSGKKVDLQLSGEGTEVDKTVIEKITDPLVHLLRNSMDHGLEDNDERAKSAKPETGTIQLSAAHQEGEILITIIDDGRGMDRNKLITKGIERGLVEGDGSQLSDQEALKLIFQPGFSTADQVTDISGRGVGMDVVRQNLESIKGRIDLNSTLGKGTTVTLRIPLTLAIIDGMLIRCGTAHYILPILSIKESFQPSDEAITVTPDGQELVKVRELLLPVVRLHELHNITPDNHDLAQGILIVLESRNGNNMCLFVDELMGQQQTVIKGLSEYIGKLGDARGVSGCTILGNGEICLILDVSSLEEAVSSEE